MRVIAGRFGGRNFASPHTYRTHPMSDKVRGALFNALGDLDELTVLDAYAGSGACGIEAVSRGALQVVAVEIDPQAVRTIIENVRTLGLVNEISVKRMSVSSWSRHHTDDHFDVVLADPPYDAIQLNALELLTTHVKPGGLFCLSWPGSESVPEFAGLEIAAHKSYGDAQLAFYRRPG